MKTDRTWEITFMGKIEVITTKLVDGSTFVYPVSDVTTISEWLNIVKEVERDRLVDLMDAKVVYEFPDQKTQA